MKYEIRAGALLMVLLTGLTVLGMWGCPLYRVYEQRKEGEAQLAKAQYNRQTAVVEANAKFESAKLLADADTIRAHGIAQSNQIIGKSITQQYLQWMWVNNLENQEKSVIYVPSQNGIPIMPIQEATRLQPSPIINQQP